MARVLITGGTGFIGSHLVRDCVARGDKVTVLARAESDPWRLSGLLGKISLCRVQCLDPQQMATVIAQIRPERVFHLAATTRFVQHRGLIDLNHAFYCNVEPLQVLLDSLRRLDKMPRAVVRAGTLAEMGEAARPHGPDDCERPGDAYGVSALIGTHLMRLARQRLGMPAVTARLCLSYGGDQSSDFLIPDIIRKSLAGAMPLINQPQARRDLIHVDDVVTALQLIADHAEALPSILAVSTGKPVRMADAAALIAGIMGRDDQTDPSPSRPNNTRHTLSCRPSRELRALGWKPQVALARGLRQVVEWERSAIAHPGKERRA